MNRAISKLTVYFEDPFWIGIFERIENGKLSVCKVTFGAEPPYEFCEYLDGEYKETDIRIRHNEAVTAFGRESELIKFKKLPEVKVLSVYHKGAYDKIGEAYAFLMKYAEENGYTTAGLARECYIDGIWNKESEEEWLTEIQLPIE